MACAERRIHWKRSERPLQQKRNDPRHGEMATSPSKEVTAPQHFKTPRARHVLEHALGVPLEALAELVRLVRVVVHEREVAAGDLC